MEILQQSVLMTLLGALRYFLITLPAFWVFYQWGKDYFSQTKIQKRTARREDFFREIRHSLVSVGVMSALAAVVLFSPMVHYTRFYTGDEMPAWWPFVAVLLALAVHDTYFYWMHRLVHHPKIFKTVHLTHHKSTNPSPFASYAFHWTEAITEGMILPIILFLIPMNIEALYGFILAGFVINVYGHLGHEIMPRWFRHSVLFEVFNTSTHHNLHHSKFKGNYGLYFRIWDRLMGTENPNYVADYDRIQQQRFGEKVQPVQA